LTATTTLGKLADRDAAVARFRAAGLGPATAQGKQQLLADCVARLRVAGLGDGARALGFFVPGRVEVLGKHTDYAGGKSIVAATEQGFVMVAVPHCETHVVVHRAPAGAAAEFALAPDLTPTLGDWTNYPMTVARRVARNFASEAPLRGATIAFASDLPPAAGMSSSSALMVATFLCLSAVNDLPARELYRRNIDGDLSLAEYLGTVENGQTYGQLTGDAGVGTFGGSEDHTAMLCCRTGALNEYAYCPVHFHRAIELDEKLTFAIAASDVTAVKTGAAREHYNRASKLASAVVAEWRKVTGRDDLHIAAALRSGPDAAENLRDILRRASRQDFTVEQLTRRLEHFLIEDQQVIPAAGDALEAGDLATFGRLVDRSQEAAEQLLGNQIPETVHLARTAREGGAAAASSFGAGFGGSVWALVRRSEAQEFLRDWTRRYEQRFPDRVADSRFFLTRPGPAAFPLV